MGKRIILTMLLAFVLTGCFNTSQRKNDAEETGAANKPTAVSTPTPDIKLAENYPDFKEIKLNTADNNLEQIGRALFEMYLKSYTETKVSDSVRIDSYTIDVLKLQKGDINSFQCYVQYSIKRSTEKYVLAGNGVEDSDGWVRRRTAFVNIKKESDGFIITGINTSP